MKDIEIIKQLLNNYFLGDKELIRAREVLKSLKKEVDNKIKLFKIKI